MGEFHLKDTLEYRYITRKRGVIDAIISKLNYFGPPYTGVIADVLTQTADEAFIKSYYEADYQKHFSAINRRFSTFWTLTRSTLFKNIAAELNFKVEKNFGDFFMATGFSFAEYYFWHLCETDGSVTGRLAKDTVEAISASVLRKKAFETYKKGHTTEALEGFTKALELMPEDFTVLFQLGSYYFFEKGDHIKAEYYFARCASFAREFSPAVEALALCFSSLLLKLKAIHRGERAMVEAAMTLCEKAVKSAPELAITRYCRLQTIAGLCAFGESSDYFLKEAEKVFEIDNAFLLQAIFDNAFDPVLEPLAEMVIARYDKALAECARAMEETDRKFLQLPQNLETSADKAKIFQLQKEFQAIQQHFNKNKTCFDIKEVVGRLEKVSHGIEQVLFNNRVQQKFMQIRQYCSAIVAEFKKDFGDRMKPYNDALKKRQELTAAIEDINAKYFVASDLSTDEECPATAADTDDARMPPSELLNKPPQRRNASTEKKIKSRCSACVFWTVEAFLFVLWVPAGSIPFTLFIMTTVVNLCLAPAYALIGAEIFYFAITTHLDQLKREYSKLDLKLNLSNTLPGEAEMKAREKYSKLIADEFRISQIDARNVLEAALTSDCETMKALVRTMCK